MAQNLLPASKLFARRTLFSCTACRPQTRRSIARWQSTESKTLNAAPNLSSTSPTISTALPATDNPPSTPAPSSELSSPPSPNSPLRKRRIPTRLIYTTCFIILGAVFGTAIAGIISPPAYPQAGSAEDQRLLALLSQDLDNLPIIRELRKKCRTDAQIDAEAERTGGVRLVERRVSERVRDKIGEEEGSDWAISKQPEWRELPTNMPLASSLMAAMAGIGGTGVQRMFYSKTEKQFLMITWIGSALCGWPGVCHGGAIATFFSEATRAAILEAVRDGLNTASPAVELKQMDLTYMKATNASGFFAIRAQIKDDERGELAVVAQLETLDGLPCAKATTIWTA